MHVFESQPRRHVPRHERRGRLLAPDERGDEELHRLRSAVRAAHVFGKSEPDLVVTREDGGGHAPAPTPSERTLDVGVVHGVRARVGRRALKREETRTDGRRRFGSARASRTARRGEVAACVSARPPTAHRQADVEMVMTFPLSRHWIRVIRNEAWSGEPACNGLLQVGRHPSIVMSRCLSRVCFVDVDWKVRGPIERRVRDPSWRLRARPEPNSHG